MNAPLNHPAPTADYSEWVLTLACDSARSQVAAVCNVLDEYRAYLRSVATHDDERTGRFFIRIHYKIPHPPYGSIAQQHRMVLAEMKSLTRSFGHSTVGLHAVDARAKVVLMVSKMDHCLLHLLDGWRTGELPMEPVAIVSNHLECGEIARAEGIPFLHLPVTPANKSTQEAQVRALVSSTDAEFVVLARYMQVLSDDFVKALYGRVINIHHSFLPSFKGARPYEQAWERGVKLIGATAHFVTADLDEGPIIEQAVEPVTHADSPERLVQIGRHVESRVLRQALRNVLERRVFLNGTRTIVLQ